MTFPQEPAPQQPQPQYTDAPPPAGNYQQPQPGTEYPTGAYQAPPTGQYQQPGYIPPATPGFVSALFDFSFRTFATPTLLQITYIVGLITMGLTYVVMVIVGFGMFPPLGVAYLILGLPLMALGVLVLRLCLEFFAVTHRTNECIEEINRRGKGM